MSKEKLNPVHPGEIILEEFLRPLGMSQSRLALDISVHPRRINEIVPLRPYQWSDKDRISDLTGLKDLSGLLRPPNVRCGG